MEKQIFETQGSPTLSILECRGDLSISGWAKSVVRIQADKRHLEARQEGETIMITCHSDLCIEAPYETKAQVNDARGDVRIKRIQGDISLDIVHGDLVLSRVGAVTIQETRGDLSVRLVEGDLTVQAVRGDMSVRNVSGRLKVGQVGRDLGVRELLGDATAMEVQGDIRLRTAFAAGNEYQFKANGDIVARVPVNTNADLTLRSGRNQIRLKAELADKVETDGEITGRLGDGGAAVLLEAGRDLVLVARESDWGTVGATIGAIGAEIGVEFGSEFADLAEEIAAQVEAHMAEMSVQLEEKLSHIEVDIDQRAAQAAERAAEHARRQMERAAERLRRKAEREAERARRRVEKARWKVARKSTPPKPEPAGEPVSDEERLTILNMVAEGKISIEEAESLLDTLHAQVSPEQKR